MPHRAAGAAGATPTRIRPISRAVSDTSCATILNEQGLSLHFDNPTTGTLVGYARCSTDSQDLTVQQQRLRELGVAEDRIYLDYGLSGTNRARHLRRIRGRPAQGVMANCYRTIQHGKAKESV
ncbi:recombinase family protein [Mycobacterium heidelbergense]|uniref:recombinase family protein n=1 Tax=Mycobacterium heidelbergense TaxID=53376 RepID=UPI0031FE1626